MTQPMAAATSSRCQATLGPDVGVAPTTGTVRVAVLTDVENIWLEDRPTPVLGEGDALVDVIASGVCGSDVHLFRADPSPAPLVLGHELVGRVRTAPSYPQLVGLRVAIDPHLTCGTCNYCTSSRYNLCRTVRFLADPPTDGGFASQIVVPARRCYPLPDSMSDEEGALVEPAAVAVWAIDRSRLTDGEAVLVIGAGPVGRLTARAALAEGAGRVVLVDPNRSRLDAETNPRIEILTGLDDLEPPDVFDVVVECSGAPGTIRDAITVLAAGGRVVAVGIGRSPTAEIDLLGLQSREGELLGSYRYRGIFDRVIDLIASSRLPVADLVTHRFDLNTVADALRAAGQNPRAVKAVVHITPRLNPIGVPGTVRSSLDPGGRLPGLT